MSRRQPLQLLPALGVFVAVVLLLAARPPRGWNLWFQWQVESAERFDRWLSGGGSDAAKAAFEQAPRLFPLTGWLAAALSPSGGEAEALHTLGIVAAGLLAAMLFVAAARYRGTAAGLVAAALFAGAPRLWTAAELYPSTLLGLLLATAPLALLTLGRSRVAWVSAAALLAAGLLCGWAGWWMLALGLYLLLVDPAAPPGGGRLQLREGAWPRLLLLLLFVLVALLLPPPLRSPKAWGAMLRAWLDAGPEPLLAGGELFGRERLSLTAVVSLLVRTLPPLYWPGLLAATGFLLVGRGASGSRALCPVLRRWFAALAFCLLLPVVFRSGFHAGQDLLLYALPLLSLLAALGLTTAVELAARRLPALAPWGAALLTALIGLAALDVTRSWQVPEAFGTGWLGGTNGLIRDGYSRFAHGPLPADWLAAQLHPAQTRIALAANEWEYRPLVERYAKNGWLPQGTRIVPLGEADGVLVPLEDAIPERISHLRDAARALSSRQAAVYAAGEVPLLVWVPTPRPQAAPAAKPAARGLAKPRSVPLKVAPKSPPRQPASVPSKAP